MFVTVLLSCGLTQEQRSSTAGIGGGAGAPRAADWNDAIARRAFRSVG